MSSNINGSQNKLTADINGTWMKNFPPVLNDTSGQFSPLYWQICSKLKKRATPGKFAKIPGGTLV
jgi:hypothetical protein